MKIRTQFIITMLLFGIILVVVAASAIILHQQVQKNGQQEAITNNIVQGANELSYLSNDYLIYRERQQLKRWQSRFASFSRHVASLSVDKPEQQALVRNIQANQKRLKEIFDSVASVSENLSRDEGPAFDPTLLQVSLSRMAVQSQGMISDALRLSRLLHIRTDQLRELRTALMYFMVGLFGLFFLVNYMLTYRRILKSISTLQAGTTVIGSGNLDFTIREKTNDEIGDLSQAFNQMTTNLKAVTASKADLEREIAEREKAEENLHRQREWLSVTLSSIGDAVITSDTEGRITFLNPVAVTLTGWQFEEALSLLIQSVFRIINEKTHAAAENLVARVLNEKRVVALANDTALVTKDGREVPIEDSAAPIKNSAGNLIGVVLVFHDVTERRRARAALREAHERAVWLARFPDENPNPVLRASADGTVLYCNPASARLHGWTCEVGQPIQNDLLPLLGRAMAEGREVQDDVQLDGKVYIIWVAPFPEEGYVNIYGRDITQRKQAEEALRDAQKRVEADLDAMTRLQKLGTPFLHERNLESILGEIVDAAIAISEADFGNIQLMNPESSDLKIAAQRGFPKWWLDFWNSVCKGQGACGTALQRGERVIVEDVEQDPIFAGTPALEIQLKAGVRAVQSTPLVSRSGKPLGMFSTHYKTPHRPLDRALRLLDLLARQAADIIEQSQAEAALRASEERFRAVFESSSDCILVWDRQYNYLYANQAAIDHVGTTRDKVIGKNIRDGLGHFPDFMHLWMGRMDQAFATGESFRVEDVVPVGDRLVHSESQVSPIRDAAGQVFAVGVVYRDITERKRAEEALRESEQRLNRAQEIAHLGSWELDLVNNRLTWSDEVYRIFGLQPQKFGATYEAFLEAVHPGDRAAVDAAYSGSLREGTDTYEIEHRVVRKPMGEIRIVLERCEHVRDASGQTIRSIGMVHDITERKRAEEALRERTIELQQLTENLDKQVKKRTEELESANVALRQLSIRLLSAQEEERKRVAGEIHDTMGSCLSGIKFKVESAIEEIVKTPKVATESLSAVIPVVQEAIEECRRIQMDLRPSMLDDLGLLPTLSWFFRRFRTIYSMIHIEQEMTIEESDLPDSLKTVMYRIIQEAMNNAAKHSKADLIRISLRKVDNKMELFVEDNGCGFSVQQRLFLDNSKRGLGLTSMRERTELSGGSFAIESAEGKGTMISASWQI